MAPPPIQGLPAVPKMGVRARVSERSYKRGIQPPPRSDSLSPIGPPGLESRPSPRDPPATPPPPWMTFDPLGTLCRMKRSTSEGTLSVTEPKHLDHTGTAFILRRAYGSTSTLDRFLDPLKGQQDCSSPPLAPSPPHLRVRALVSPVPSIHGGKLRPVPESVCGQNGGLKRFSITPNKCFSHYDLQSVLLTMDRPSGPILTMDRSSTPPGCSTDTSTGENILPNRCACPTDPLVHSSPSLTEKGRETRRMLGLIQSHSSRSGPEISFNPNISVLERSKGKTVFPQNLPNDCDIEHFDDGATYYQEYFYGQDHQNYFGTDEKLGPVSVSIRREKLDDDGRYRYRFILRTSQVLTLRGSVLEDCVPTSSKPRSGRGLPMKDVLNFLLPELNVQNLRRSTGSLRVPELLLQLDRPELRFHVDLRFCPTSKDRTGSPALDQFLGLIDPLEGSHKFTQLNSTGSRSVHTNFRDFDLKFTVDALQMNRADDMQQLASYGNRHNVVMVIFQESDAPPFDLRSAAHLRHHVYIIVTAHRHTTLHTCYSVSVCRLREVPPFGPLVQSGWVFPACASFRNFLLTTVINAQLAAGRTDSSVAMATCIRGRSLRDLVKTFSSSESLQSSSSSCRFSFVPFGVKKKNRVSVRQRHVHLQSAGALTWRVAVLDGSALVACTLAVSAELMVLIQESSQWVAFSCHCRDVIGWSVSGGGVKVFHQHGACVTFSTRSDEDVQEITQRLQVVTGGTAALSMTLRRNRDAQLGFHVNAEGVVAHVETLSWAWGAGLRPGCRLVEICSVALATLSHQQMIDMLRTSLTVSVTVLPACGDGTPRRSFSEMFGPAPVSTVAPPTWHQVAVAPPTQTVLSNQSGRSEREQLGRIVRRSSSLSGRSTSSDPSVTHGRPAADWSISSGESADSALDWRGGAKELHRRRRTELVGAFQPSDAESSFNVKGQSSSSRSNTMSSSSSDGRHSNRLDDITAASVDSGIDSAPCRPLAPPPVAGGTLLLRDVWEAEPMQEVKPTSLRLIGRNESCCKFSRPSQRPVREQLVMMTQCDVTVAEKPSIPDLLSWSPWRPLSRSQSEDSLYHTLSLPGPCSSAHSHLTTPTHASRRCHSVFSLAEQGHKPLPLGSPQHVNQTATVLLSALRQRAALQDSDITAPSLCRKVFKLEEIVSLLQEHLLQEQQDKLRLQQQVVSLREENVRLQDSEVSRAAAPWMMSRGALP